MFRLFRYFKKLDILFLVIAAGLVVLQVYLELQMPDYTKNLTEIVSDGSANMEKVWSNGGMMLLCAAGSLASAFVCSFFVSAVASSFSFTLRQELFNHILSFSNKEMHQFHTASLITRTTNDVVQMQNFVAMGMQMLIKAPVMAVWALVKISTADISWTMATGICIVVIVIGVIIATSICIPKFKKIQRLTDDLNSAARENVTGVRVIRAFNAEDYQTAKYEKVNEEITRTNLFTSRVMSSLQPLLNLCLNGLIVAIYFIGAAMINNIVVDMSAGEEAIRASMMERVSIMGNLAAFSQYAVQVVMSFIMLVLIFIMLPRTMVSGKRINEVLKQKTSIVDGDGAKEKEGDSAIVFDHVSFSYAGDDHYAVEDINIDIKRGETVAFIGGTGCGKTTLLNVMLRYYEAGVGSIYVEGNNIKDYPLEELRRKISLAPQKASLLQGTIKENVAYGQESVDEERLHKALGVAMCDFVNDLEQKEESHVAQSGSNFSGGQKQRISIARAIYKDADILIFDDTFSALDFKTDSMVRRNIAKECAGKTVLIIAQRIGTIRGADKIIVMDKGHIVGVGKHDELIHNNEVYREIALSQLDKEEL